MSAVPALPHDPRWFQAGSLGALLVANILWFDLAATPEQSVVTVAAALAWQALFAAWRGVRFDPLSPLVTGLSLSLLLRTHDPALWLAAPGIAIGSKFLLRLRGKHVFNPAAFAIVALLAAGANVWVSPGQWGARGLVVAAVLLLGGVVLTRAGRLDTALAFAGTYAALLAGRALALGDPAAIPLHQLQSGSLLLFACFMITDPRTTPDHRLGRLAFAAAVAALAYHLQFGLQIRSGLYIALVAVSLATPLLDTLLRARRFGWPLKEITT